MDSLDKIELRKLHNCRKILCYKTEICILDKSDNKQCSSSFLLYETLRFRIIIHRDPLFQQISFE
jgi:hypothetical protein